MAVVETLERPVGPLPLGAWLAGGVLVLAFSGMFFKGRHGGGGRDYEEQDATSSPPFTPVSAMPPFGPGLGLGSFWSPLQPRRKVVGPLGQDEVAGRQHNTYIGANVNDPGSLLMVASQRMGGRAAPLVPMALQLQPGPFGWTPGL